MDEEKLNKKTSKESSTPWIETTINQKWKGIAGFLLILLTSIFAIPGAEISKEMSIRLNASTFSILQLGLISILLLPFLIWKRSDMNLSRYSRKDWVLLVLSGITRSSATITCCFALYYISVFDITVIATTKPILVALFVICLPAEEYHIFDVLPLALCVSGTLLVSQPKLIFQNGSSFQSMPPLGIFFALFSITSYTVNVILCRRLRKVSLLLSSFMQSFCGIPLAMIGLLFEDFIIPPNNLYIHIFAAAFLYLGRVAFHTAGLLFIDSLQVSVMDTTKIPMACLADYLIFKILPNWLKVFGTCFVITAVLLFLFKSQILRMMGCSKRVQTNDIAEDPLIDSE